MTTAHAKLETILAATARDAAIKARVRKSGLFTRLVMLAGALLCIAMGLPADTLERMDSDRSL